MGGTISIVSITSLCLHIFDGGQLADYLIRNKLLERRQKRGFTNNINQQYHVNCVLQEYDSGDCLVQRFSAKERGFQPTFCGNSIIRKPTIYGGHPTPFQAYWIPWENLKTKKGYINNTFEIIFGDNQMIGRVEISEWSEKPIVYNLFSVDFVAEDIISKHLNSEGFLENYSPRCDDVFRNYGVGWTYKRIPAIDKISHDSIK